MSVSLSICAFAGTADTAPAAIVAVAEPVLNTFVIHVTTFHKFWCFSRLFSACTSYPSFSLHGCCWEISSIFVCLPTLYVFSFLSFYRVLCMFFFLHLLFTFAVVYFPCSKDGVYVLRLVVDGRLVVTAKENACTTNARHRHTYRIRFKGDNIY